MMRVFVLGLDGATWDVLRPLVQQGHLPRLARLMEQGAAGTLRSVFPPLSPVAWTAVMTGKNSGKHGIFEFLESAHNPLGGRVNSSRTIQADLALGNRRTAWEGFGHRRSTAQLPAAAGTRLLPRRLPQSGRCP